ncbi:MAG: SgcJ/EcaC family oxidoreductase [Gemmatimonadota bacterium]|nr:MAG: SgcJ/EcaC family oxidoreductase [Gemmatimonadota bacterium]
MRIKSLMVAAAVGVLAVSGCYPAAGPLTEEDLAAIDGVRQGYHDALLAGDAAAVAALFTENAVEMPPHAVAREGRAAIELAYAAGPLVTEFTIAATATEGFGDLAYDMGTWSAAMQMEGMEEPYRDVGKYMTICEKQADGTWLIKATTWNSDIPLPE